MEAKISKVMEIDTVKLRGKVGDEGDTVGRLLGETEGVSLGIPLKETQKESKTANEHQENAEGKKWENVFKGDNGSWCQK